MRFLLEAPKTLFEDDRHRCVSYVPDPAVTWIVMDVSVLVGALAGRLGSLLDDAAMIEEGGRLVRYVVSKQTDEGAWFYAEPPSASHITHDNYHTGFILDAILYMGPPRVTIPAAYEGVWTSTGACSSRTAVLLHERQALPDRHSRLRAGVTFAAAEVPRCWRGYKNRVLD
jgi:hypothetical protein